MKTPWQYAETGNEFSHQVALFMWANMAVMYGPWIAGAPQSYEVAGYAKDWFETHPQLNQYAPIHELQWMHAIKNAGHGDAVRGNRSRAEGVKAGVPDIFLPVPTMTEANGYAYVDCPGLYIELKRPKRNTKAKGVPSEEQRKFHTYLKSAGYAVETCYGWEAARDVILTYLGR